MKQKKDGYEPSDTETEGYESSWNDSKDKGVGMDYDDQQSNLAISKKFSAVDHSTHSLIRNSGKSTYRAFKDDSYIDPFSNSERRNFQGAVDDIGSSNLRLRKEEKMNHSQHNGGNKISQKLNHHRRSVTAPRLRMRDEQQYNMSHLSQRRERAGQPIPINSTRQLKDVNSHLKTLSVGELNEMIAEGKSYQGLVHNEPNAENTGSISPGDIFFSRDNIVIGTKNNVTAKNAFTGYVSPNPKFMSQRNDVSHQKIKANANLNHNSRGIASGSTGLSTSTITSAAMSRESSGRISSVSSKLSDASGRTSESTRRFTASRQKKKNESWLACMRKGTCRTTKSPERKPFDEALFIEKANVVENLRQFWADRHPPVSLNGFTFHKHEAQLLKQLVSEDSIPHILFKGPPGSGKRVLTMSLLHEIYPDSCWNVSHDLRYFQIQERKQMQVVVPLTSSAHHVELNLSSEVNAKYALLGLAKEIGSEYSINMEAKNVNPKANFKVMVLLEVDKVADDVQHLLKWIMDGYKESCKVILCCEDDAGIVESVISRCRVIKTEPPMTHEIMDVLFQIAEKEKFDLSANFASKIASKAKQNLRRAIMALEACKAHNYPFTDEQPIPMGWEETLVELAAHILKDPANTRLYGVKEKIQKLLVDFVHPKLILQKLVEQFLKRTEQNLKRELYYWHAYYNKRLPDETGTGALPKLEEFVAKFMSIYRKSSINF